MPTHQEVLDYLVELEAYQLETLMDDVYRLREDPAPMPAVYVGDPHFQDYTYQVIITGIPRSKRVIAMKTLREMTGCSLRQVREAVDNLPYVVEDGLDQDRAEAVQRMFVGMGFDVTYVKQAEHCTTMTMQIERPFQAPKPT